ncbi:MAG: hypothetical protein QXX12_05145 [Nanopusillaceae archaeon]
MERIRVVIRERKVVLSPVVLPTVSKLFVIYPNSKNQKIGEIAENMNREFWSKYLSRYNTVSMFMEEVDGVPLDVLIARDKENPNPYEFIVFYVFFAGLDDEEKYHRFRLQFRERLTKAIDEILMEEMKKNSKPRKRRKKNSKPRKRGKKNSNKNNN